MPIYKLHLEEFDQIDYHLIAIHTTLEDYKIAYKINNTLNISLSKNEKEIPSKILNQTTFFSRYTFEDSEKMITWNLVQNKNTIETNISSNSFNLFGNDNVSRQISFIDELKKVDFLLKLEYETPINLKDIIKSINQIDFISTAYEVNVNKIKSKNNLIF